MLLRLLVCIAIIIFCIWQGLVAAGIPAENGRNYFPFAYILAIVLLSSGLNKFGLITWPLVTLILVVRGHLIIGWIPLIFILYNVFGNKLLNKLEEKRKEQ
ncbi:MAG: hypothetical protein KAH05_00175 [Clostridiales bacterium]|nr:hypothetical protein [Clostridiales bacterium]